MLLSSSPSVNVLESDLAAQTKRLEEIHVAHKSSLVQIVEQTKQACDAAYQQVRTTTCGPHPSK